MESLSYQNSRHWMKKWKVFKFPGFGSISVQLLSICFLLYSVCQELALLEHCDFGYPDGPEMNDSKLQLQQFVTEWQLMVCPSSVSISELEIGDKSPEVLFQEMINHLESECKSYPSIHPSILLLSYLFCRLEQFIHLFIHSCRFEFMTKKIILVSCYLHDLKNHFSIFPPRCQMRIWLKNWRI